MATWPEIRAGIFAGESGGDYDALFGFSNRPGRQFGNTRLTDMTVDQAINFSRPGNPYANWVKGQIGRVATPMGAYQIVGTTLRGAKEGLGLTGSELMDEALQDRLGQYILAQQGTGAWEGYRGPRDPSSVPASDPYADMADGPKGQEEYRLAPAPAPAPPLPPPYNVADRPIAEPRTEMARLMADKPDPFSVAFGKGLGAVGKAFGSSKPVYSGARAMPAARVDAPGDQPTIDAQMAEVQRQRLAEALARLNAGRLA